MRISERGSRYVLVLAIAGIAVIAVLCVYLLGKGIGIAEKITAIGTLLTAIGLGYAALQLRTSKVIAGSEFVLRVYEMMQAYNDVHLRLTGDGDWAKDEGPKSDKEWMNVSRYMGLFEPIQLLLAGNLLDIKMIDVLYSHRVLAIARNPVIFQNNLIQRSYRWVAFTDLWMRLRSQYTFSSISKQEGYGERESEHAAVIMELRRRRGRTSGRQEPPNPAGPADQKAPLLGR